MQLASAGATGAPARRCRMRGRACHRRTVPGMREQQQGARRAPHEARNCNKPLAVACACRGRPPPPPGTHDLRVDHGGQRGGREGDIFLSQRQAARLARSVRREQQQHGLQRRRRACGQHHGRVAAHGGGRAARARGAREGGAAVRPACALKRLLIQALSWARGVALFPGRIGPIRGVRARAPGAVGAARAARCGAISPA